MQEDRLYRAIRPIYEAIDGRRYKVAVKLCDAKKLAQTPLVLVLKAHCLERLGKSSEALALARLVESKFQPTDETVLNTMSLVFRLCGAASEMTPIYERAYHNNPASLDLASSLFHIYVKTYQFDKQQILAMKMYKSFHQPKFVYSAALSLFLQYQQFMHTHHHQVSDMVVPAELDDEINKKQKLLLLAEKMVVKVLRDGQNSQNSEAIRLVIDLLLEQQKKKEALAVFDEFVKAPSDVSGSVKSNGRYLEGEGVYDEEIEVGPMQVIDRLALEANLSFGAEDFERSSQVFQKLLEQYNADDWAFLVGFIEAMFSQTKHHQSEMPFTDAMHAVLSVLNKLQDTEIIKLNNNTGIFRGPFLAEIHVYKLMFDYCTFDEKVVGGISLDVLEQKFTHSILNYIEKFHTKSCCFSDLKQYLIHFHPLNVDGICISKDVRGKLLTRIIAMKNFSSERILSYPAACLDKSNKEIKNTVQELLLSIKVLRFIGYFEENIGDDGFEKERCDFIVHLVEVYKATIGFNLASKGGQRELQCGDDLVLLASHFLLDLANHYAEKNNEKKTKQLHQEACLLDVARILEDALSRSPYNYQMKLVLVRIYCYLGAFEAAISRYHELDVKQIQLDSLTYLILDEEIISGHLVEAKRICESVIDLHSSNNTESVDFISKSYRLGHFSKAREVTEFNLYRMQNSHQLAICQTELIHLSILAECKSYDNLVTYCSSTQAPEIFKDNVKISSNQDRSILINWDHPSAAVYSSSLENWPSQYLPNKRGEKIVNCDRSSDLRKSVLWIQFKQISVNMLFASIQRELCLFNSHFATYQNKLVQLGFIGGNQGDEVEMVWDLSVVAGKSLSALLTSLQTNEPKWDETIVLLNSLSSKLEELIRTTSEYTFKNDVQLVSFCPSVVGFLSVLTYHAGQMFTMLICSMAHYLHRRPKKKKKKTIKDTQSEKKECQELIKKIVRQCYLLFENSENFVRHEELSKSLTQTRSMFSESEFSLSSEKLFERIDSSKTTMCNRFANLLHDKKTFLESLRLK